MLVTSFFVWTGFAHAAPPSKGKKPAKRTAKPAEDAKPAEPAKAPEKPLTEAEKIVEKMVTALGGREVLEAIRSMYATGTVTAITRVGNRSARLHFYTMKPTYQRVDQFFGSQVFSLTTYPGGGWIRQNGAILNLPRSMIEVTESEAARQELELRYRKEGVQVTQMGARDINGTPCHVILFQDKKGRQTTYYIAKKTHLLYKRTYLGPHPLGQGQVSISTVQRDYRWLKIDGKKVQVPFVLESYIGGNKTSTIRFQKIQLNATNVNKKVFRIPSPVE
ncbi:MAG: hypothetical protein H6727_14415 [Myxococcales bacterium]|nr:hypothetical protein [Myxococcales bacterium]